jgi:hypothetical protein
MKYQDAIEKIPNVTYLYHGVTVEELDSITVSKYEVEDDAGEGLHVVGTLYEIPELNHKLLTPVQALSMTFG